MLSLRLLYHLLTLVSVCLCVTKIINIDNKNSTDETHETNEKNKTKVDKPSGQDPEMTMTACELAEARGFQCEEHQVETKDGYIVTLHRLPVIDQRKCRIMDKVVLFNHGFLSSSIDFLINGANESLGYLFSDACYDVWLLNTRGNIYSLKHNLYTTDDEEFWKFSFDEMAQYEMPAIVDYIIHKTNIDSLYYIGFSQGTTIGFEAFSENKELAKKIRFFGALAPVGYLGNLGSITSTYAELTDDALYMVLGRKAFNGPDWKREMFVKNVCTNSITNGVCVKLGESLGGKLSTHFNKSRIGVYFMHTPAGSSVQNMVHYAQMIRSGRSQKYSYPDHLTNLAKYGSMKAPDIKFSKMKLPVAIFTGGSDIVANKQDANRLISELPNVVAQIRISDYSHLDFIYATNVGETIFKPLSFIMKNY